MRRRQFLKRLAKLLPAMALSGGFLRSYFHGKPLPVDGVRVVMHKIPPFPEVAYTVNKTPIIFVSPEEPVLSKISKTLGTLKQRIEALNIRLEDFEHLITDARTFEHLRGHLPEHMRVTVLALPSEAEKVKGDNVKVVVLPKELEHNYDWKTEEVIKDMGAGIGIVLPFLSFLVNKTTRRQLLASAALSAASLFVGGRWGERYSHIKYVPSAKPPYIRPMASDTYGGKYIEHLFEYVKRYGGEKSVAIFSYPKPTPLRYILKFRRKKK